MITEFSFLGNTFSYARLICKVNYKYNSEWSVNKYLQKNTYKYITYKYRQQNVILPFKFYKSKGQP